MLKQCSKCQENKSIEEFSKDRCKSDGLTSACRECNKNREKKRRENGGYFTNEQKQVALEKYDGCCQTCNSTRNLEVDHKLPQNLCKSNTASNNDNAWVLCKSCNIAKGTRILKEVIQEVPGTILGPMLLSEYAKAIAQGRFKEVPVKIGEKQFTEVKIK